MIGCKLISVFALVIMISIVKSEGENIETEVEANKTSDDNANMKRFFPGFATPFSNFVPMSTLFANQAYQSFPPVVNYQNSIPILARVIPIDVNNIQLGNEFTAYIYSTSSVSLAHPSYSTLCTRDTIMTQNFLPGSSSNGDIETFKQTQLKPLLDKMNALSAFMAKLWNKEDIQIASIPEVNPEEYESPTDVAINKETPNLGTTELGSNHQIQIVNNNVGAANVNFNKGDIFQCEGVTCPDDSVTCRITINAIEPEYDELLTTVACLSSDNKILQQAQTKSENPNKGIDHHVLQTHSRNGSEISQNIATFLKNNFFKKFV